MERLVVTDLIDRHAARLARLTTHLAGVGARRSDDATARVAGGAVSVVAAIDGAVRFEIADARAETQACIRALGTVRTARVQLARLRWGVVAHTEVFALAVDLAHVAMSDLDAVGVRLAFVAALAFDAAEAVRFVALAARLARGEAAARLDAAAVRAAVWLFVLVGAAGEDDPEYQP